jgi:primosomal protein N' (replication factor Y)
MPSTVYIDLLLPLPLHGTFTYSVSGEKAAGIQPGMRVVVPFGPKKIYTGLVAKVHHQKPDHYEVKEVLSVPDVQPVVLESQIRLWEWISDYYLCSPGEVFKAALPARLKLETRSRSKPVVDLRSPDLSILNDSQQKALQAIREAFLHSDVTLLHGVTSSGKTEIYIHLIRETIEKGQQVLYLLPEIALTTQIISRLKAVFGSRIAVYHSKYSCSERIKTWNRMLAHANDHEEAIQIVLGVRSAVFLPFSNPGLIIIDEEPLCWPGSMGQRYCLAPPLLRLKHTIIAKPANTSWLN